MGTAHNQGEFAGNYEENRTALFVLGKEVERIVGNELRHASGPGDRGFTRTELLAVIVSVALLALLAVGLLLPMLATGGSHRRISCINNLKQIGLAFRTWEGDYNDLYPMGYYTNENGTMKFADPANFFRYFQVMSNELYDPKILVCPEDKRRTKADNFGLSFSGTNISYFIGLDADEKYPTRLLSGDRNLTNGMKLKNGILEVTTNQTVGWTQDRHKGAGNILFSDGSVQPFSAQGLKDALAKTGLATNRLAMP